MTAIAEAVRRTRAGLGDPDRPVGSFLFLGPTGVGKTELAKALAEALFGDEDRMIRLDMSEFQERHTVSRLVGAPPGYVGYDEAGQLTEAVRRNPYSVVLLDEIEKAHPDVFNILLQVLDDGRLTDGQGRTVDFRNTVVIMTSNLGSDLIAAAPARLRRRRRRPGASQDGRRGPGHGRLREAFRPEFLNRIDEIVVFRQLDAPSCAGSPTCCSRRPPAAARAGHHGRLHGGGGRLARRARLPAGVRRPAAAPGDPARGRQPALAVLLAATSARDST